MEKRIVKYIEVTLKDGTDVRGYIWQKGKYLVFEQDNGETWFIPIGEMEYQCRPSYPTHSSLPANATTFLDMERSYSYTEDFIASYS